MKWKMSARTCVAASLLTLSLISTAGARIITVDDDAPADFNNIQAAINDANDWDVVEVKPGTYTGPGNCNIRFNGKAITVRGTDPEDFDIVAATVIDCEKQARSRGFIFESGEDANSVLSGLTVTNAYHEHSYYGGGGIGCNDSSPVITNCIITGNRGRGGGIGVRFGSLTVKNCIISNNHSVGYGGGIYGSGLDSLTVENSLIIGNTTTLNGGGIRYLADSIVIRNCVIAGNKAGEFGGGITGRLGQTLIESCTITGNVARDMGGGLYFWYENSRAMILNSVVYGNHAPVGSQIGIDDVSWNSTISLSWCDLQGGRDEMHIDPDCTIDWGPGNIDADPCFADPGYWGHIADPNIHVEPNDPNATWVDGDHHLKSQAGRCSASDGGLMIDEVTSLCIDAGDPNYPIGPEPFPNGGRMNIGVYGGTAEASKSYFDKPPCETIVAGDINGDCTIDGRDFALLARNWLISDLEPPNPLRPGRATNPYPAAGAIDPPLSPGPRGSLAFILSWQAGHRADSHDVYFGTVSPGVFQGNQTETEFLGGAASDFTSGTYYWRIDEVSGDVRTTGPVWTFTVEGPPAATDPYPADGAEHTSVPLVLSWQPGEGAETYDVYFGTESPGNFQGSQTGTTFDPGTLESQRTYYWRIDEISDCGKTIGAVWSFHTSPPDAATDPYPVDGGVYTSTAVTLSWQAGAGAATHDVYFGTESPGQFQGNQAGTTFTRSGLEAQRTYYWRIDEVNSYGKTAGPVWQFTCLPSR